MIVDPHRSLLTNSCPESRFWSTGWYTPCIYIISTFFFLSFSCVLYVILFYVKGNLIHRRWLDLRFYEHDLKTFQKFKPFRKEMLYNLYVVIQANLDFQQASNVKIPNNTVLNGDMLFTAVLKFLIRFL